MNRAALILITILAACTMSLQAFAAPQFYITVQGAKQGAFKGESTRHQHKRQMEGLAYSHEMQTPTNAATGRATGRLRHGAVTITKALGAASPQLMQALVTNETLKSVRFQFVRLANTGKEQVYVTIRLRNARVTQIRYDAGSAQAQAARKDLEHVSFTYDRIEVTSHTGKTTATASRRAR